MACWSCRLISDLEVWIIEKAGAAQLNRGEGQTQDVGHKELCSEVAMGKSGVTSDLIPTLAHLPEQ